MPSKSKSQQRLFGIVHSCQKNDKKKICSEPRSKKIIKSISKKDAKDFASTKHEDLPDRLEDFRPQGFKKWFESQKGEKMEENKCMCDCPPCKNGDCSSCTCKNCKCENCTCN